MNKNPTLALSAALAKLSLCASIATLLWGAPPAVRAANYQTSILSQNPLVYYRFGETGVPPVDVASNSGSFGAIDNGVYGATVLHGVPGLWSAGGNTAASCNGGSAVDVPYNDNMNPAGPFTIEFWANPSNTLGAGALNCVVSSADANSPRSGWLIYQANAGWNFRMYNQNGINTAVSIIGGPPPVPGTWYHVVGVWDGTNAYIYTDGTLQTSQTPPSYVPDDNAYPGSCDFTVGWRSDAGFSWAGAVDEVALYTTALSSNQIAAHYATGTNNPAGYAAQVSGDHPVCYYRFNEPKFVPLPAVNLGSAGATLNGGYFSPAQPGVPGPRPSDGYAGFEANNDAAAFNGTNGFVAMYGLGLNTNTVTMTCWFYCNIAEGQVPGMIYNRADNAGGLDLSPNGAGGAAAPNIGYVWDNNDSGTYLWDSGLIPPLNTWVYTALVIEPDQAVIYMYDGTNFSSSIHVYPNINQSFPTLTAIGQDTLSSGRTFNGTIDEVTIFDRSLSPGEIQSQVYAATGTNKPVIITDVQPPPGGVYQGQSFSLSVDVAGTPLIHYNWRKGGVSLGALDNATFTDAVVAAGDGGNYDVVITNGFGAVTSSAVMVTVLPPAAPTNVVVAPTADTVYQGGSASFLVTAVGSSTFTYQWYQNSLVLSNQTKATLSLANVQASNSGTYFVTVADTLGSATSSVVTLNVLVPNAYRAAVLADSPVAYYPLDETSGTVAFEALGRHNGVYSNSPTLGGPGATPQSGTSVAFDGSTQSVQIPNDPGLNFSNQITLEAWIKNEDATLGVPTLDNIISHGYSSEVRETMYRISGGDYTCGSYINGGVGSTSFPIPTNDFDHWVHLVAANDGVNWYLYRNGLLAAFTPAPVGAVLINAPWGIAARGWSGSTTDTRNFNGSIDEAAIYNYALSADQVFNHYNLSLYGTTAAPSIAKQPAPQTVIAGQTASFSVVAAGSPPFSYQWASNSVPLAGATSSALSIPNAYYTDAAAYSVTVSNGVGSAPSVAANLTVVPPPTFARVTNGLVCHLTFDGNVLDSSGNANDGAINLSGTLPTGSPQYVPGKVGAQAIAVYMDFGNGLFDYVSINSSTTLSFVNSFTVAFWVNYTGLPNDLPMIGNAVSSTYNAGWVFTDETGKIEYTAYSTDPANPGYLANDPVPGSPLINNGTWHHIAGSFDRVAGTIDTYVDGVLVNSQPLGGLASLDNAGNSAGGLVAIGQDPTGLYDPGANTGFRNTYKMDDLGIWNRGLSAYEIASIYYAGQNGLSFDVVGPVMLTAKQTTPGHLDLSWSAGTLQQAANLAGPWTPVAGAAAPFYRAAITGAPATFFRVHP